MAEDHDFTDELALLLFEMDTGGKSTAAITASITRAIVHWASEHSWRVRTEARVEVPAASVVSSTRQLGFVDVLVCRGGCLSDVAIEIDSAHKPWSVVKLQHAAAAGMSAIWVRWGDDEWAGVYEDIEVIQLRLVRRTRARDDADQPTLWP